MAALLAAAFALALFAPLTWTDRLAANGDTYLGMALIDAYVEEGAAWLAGRQPGRSVWPAADVHRLTEAMPLLGWLVALPRAAGLSWKWTYLLVVIAVFSANAGSIALAAGRVFRDRTAGLVAGLGFAFANVLFAHLEHMNAVVWVLPAISTYYLDRALHERRFSMLALACLLLGLQTALSMYVFAFAALWLALLAASYGRGLFAFSFRRWLGAGLLAAVAALPMVAYYLLARSQPVLLPPQEGAFAHSILFGLSPSDWFRRIDGQSLWGFLGDRDPSQSHWQALRSCGSFGILWLVMAASGCFVSGRRGVAIGLCAIVAALFSLRSLGTYGSPFGWLATVLPLANFLRIVSRFQLLVVFAATFAVAGFVASLRRRLSGPTASTLVAVLLAAHLYENLPVPVPSYGMLSLEAPPRLVEALSSQPGAVVLHLPTEGGASLASAPTDLSLGGREYLYMIWQTQHGANTVNGGGGYLPPLRWRIDSLARTLPSAEALDELAGMGVTHIAFHPSLILDPRERRHADLGRVAGLETIVAEPDLLLWALPNSRLPP